MGFSSAASVLSQKFVAKVFGLKGRFCQPRP